jgi:hypothetical protein
LEEPAIVRQAERLTIRHHDAIDRATEAELELACVWDRASRALPRLTGVMALEYITPTAEDRLGRPRQMKVSASSPPQMIVIGRSPTGSLRYGYRERVR